MSLDKSITHVKEFRKKYRGEKVIDRTCLNRICGWCKENRTHKNDKKELKAMCELEEWENGNDKERI